MLEANQWILLNALTYKIHRMKDFDEMRLYLIQQLRYMIDFDAASFYISNPAKPRELIRPIGYKFSMENMQNYINGLKKIDYSEGMMYTGKNIAYRESDILKDEIRVTTEYYKQVYGANNFHFSLHLNICFEEQFMGVLSFFRTKGKPDFEYDDIFVLDMIKDHLAFRVYDEYERMSNGIMSIKECAAKYNLSAREEEVLEALMSAKALDEIADELDIAVNTLKKHINSIYAKTGFLSRMELHDRVMI